MLLDEVSQKLHQHGHEVRMLLHTGNPIITGNHKERRHLSQCCYDQLLQIFDFQGFPTPDEQLVTKPAAGLWERNTSKNIIGGFWSCKHNFYSEGATLLVCTTSIYNSIWVFFFSHW